MEFSLCLGVASTAQLLVSREPAFLFHCLLPGLHEATAPLASGFSHRQLAICCHPECEKPKVPPLICLHHNPEYLYPYTQVQGLAGCGLQGNWEALAKLRQGVFLAFLRPDPQQGGRSREGGQHQNGSQNQQWGFLPCQGEAHQEDTEMKQRGLVEVGERQEVERDADAHTEGW